MVIEWTRPLLGGLLIGAGVALQLVRNRQVAGISGIVSRLLQGAWGEHSWRLLFVIGLLLPALVLGPGPVRHGLRP
jgi:hypothetical protein